ncbi:tyrosine-type recombinase/integrase [Mycobacterium heckeshornense]|uniref:tyrosine-type recombinase/integrase n=1 Tax=Mycobacterium heckeshornense TaxID=110505 RepID=UPI00067201C5|nr:tyrosine-type recombinase/integrase [Mycobacterium heckeshornense]KMV23312.1 hypothetical protein ACT16_06440 [Mycobacterium heckeshornense]
MSDTPHPLSFPLPAAWDSAIAGWMTWLSAAGSSSATRRLRRAHLRYTARLIGAAAPDEVTTAQLVEVIGAGRHSAEYRRSLRSSLLVFYAWATGCGLVAENPALDLPKIRAAAPHPRPAPDDVWAHLQSQADERTLLMARLACEAGLRRAEVARVHTDDLLAGADGPELIVHGKGARQRTVPITPSLAAAIRAVAPFGGYVFPGRIDGHISPDRVGRLVSKAMPPGWSMHKLRHRFATRGYAGTGNLRAVQEALGHVSVATTQRYTAVSSRDIRAVSEAAARKEAS